LLHQDVQISPANTVGGIELDRSRPSLLSAVQVPIFDASKTLLKRGYCQSLKADRRNTGLDDRTGSWTRARGINSVRLLVFESGKGLAISFRGIPIVT
jgi:hypothetical protein